jgi:hypothetical protein
MPGPASLWERSQAVQARALEAQQDAMMACQHAWLVRQRAWMTRLGRSMPGANRLTLAITAAILDGRGLLEGSSATRRARGCGGAEEGSGGKVGMSRALQRMAGERSPATAVQLEDRTLIH